jgi:hypothetical protein
MDDEILEKATAFPLQPRPGTLLHVKAATAGVATRDQILASEIRKFLGRRIEVEHHFACEIAFICLFCRLDVYLCIVIVGHICKMIRT